MEFQEMKKLESEVKGLHHLMREVHKNQVELNRVLLSRCTYSRSVRFGDPEVLQEKDATNPEPEAAEVSKSSPPSPQTEEKPVKGKTQKAVSPSSSESKHEVVQPMKAEHEFPDSSELVKTVSLPQTVVSSPSKAPSHSSSFIRNILSEDSRAGVAIIDLFLTVKMAKDNLQCLSRSNAEAFDKIRQLKTETVAIGRGYRLLLDDMRDLLTRMNESLLNRRPLPAVIHLRGKQSYKNKLSDYVLERTGDEENSRGSQTPMTSQESDVDTVRSDDVVRDDADVRGARRKTAGSCGNPVKRERQMADISESSSSGCLSCFVSSHKDILFDELPDLSEESLASFMATLYRMQKGERRVCETCKSSSLFAPLGKDDESDGKLSLSDSSFRMFCNICEILDGAAREDLGSDQDLTDDDKEDRYSFKSCFGGPKDDRSISHQTTGTSTSRPEEETPKNCTSCRKKSHRTKSSKREAAVETEYEFDDTMGQLVRPLQRPEPKAKPSVTCMGDLTRAVPGKKNVSTLTTANNILSYRKLPNDIRSKIKKIRSKKNLKAEKQKSGRGSRRASGKNKAEGRIASEDPDGPVKDDPMHCLRLAPPGQPVIPVHSALAPHPSTLYLMGCARDDEYLSDDSFHNCDSDSADAGFSSGEDDMEEFVEIYNESTRAIGTTQTQQEERAITWNNDSVDVPESRNEFAPTNSFLGFLHKTTLKTIRALFFEIQKCYPAYFVQEILPKRLVPTPDEPVDDESISLNPGENKQKKVIIKGSSTDFVIYIQVEMDEGSRTGSQDFILEHRMSTPTQAGSFSHPGQMGPEKKEEEDDDGQSVGDVWEECDGGRTEDLEELGAMVAYSEMERISYGHRMQAEGLFVDARAQRAIKEKETRRIGTAVRVVMKRPKRYADVWLHQNCQQKIFFWVRQTGSQRTAEPAETVPARSAELERALTLIREVENDIADVKLSDAISILPRLEWELRKHLRSKMKILGEAEQGNDVIDRNLFPSVDVWPEEDAPEVGSKDASERMRNLLMMLTELEQAIKANENACRNSATFGKYDSSKVYKLLRALVANIQGLEGDASVSSLSQTLDIASQLDNAVREYDSAVRKRPVDNSSPESAKNAKTGPESVDSVPEKQHLKNVRRKVFQTVEGEALQLEGRVEKDFARLTQLERENDEAMTFLEAFLQKMGRRMSELNSLKCEIKNLSTSIRDKQESLMEKIAQKNKEKEEREAEAKKRARELKEAEAEAEKRAAQAKEAEAEAQRRAAQVKEAEEETKRRAAQLKEAEVEALRRANQLKEAEAQRRAAQLREAEAEKRAAEAKEVEVLRRISQAKEYDAQRRAAQLREAEAEALRRAAQAEAERRANQIREAQAEAQRRAAQAEAERRAAQIETERRANQMREAQAEAQRRAAQAEAERRAIQMREAQAEALRRAAQAEAERRAIQMREAQAEAQRRAAQAEAERRAAQMEIERRAALLKEAEAEAQRRVAQAEAERRATLLKEAEAEAQKRATQLKEAESKKRAAQLKEAEAEAEKRAAQLKEAEAQKRAALVREAEAKSKAAEMKVAEAEAQRWAHQLKDAEGKRWGNQLKETDTQRATEVKEPEKKTADLKEPEKKPAEQKEADRKATEQKEPEKKAADLKEAENKGGELKEAEAQEWGTQMKESEAPRRVTQVKEAEIPKDPRPSSPKEVVLRETVSGLLLALDRLKARAREKNQLCREILSSSCSDKMRLSGNSSRRASRSSFTAKHTDTLTSSVKTFRKIGPTSLYLAWTKPEGSLKEFVSGYEIYLNGKLNQKVRDAARLQAVLYSVDCTNGVDLEMYAIAESHPKTLLLTARYQED